MKKYIITRLILVVLISTIILISLSAFFLWRLENNNFYHTSLLRINQLFEILDENTKGISTLNEDLKDDFFIRLRALTYILDSNPALLDSPEELNNLANILEVDQIHIFNKDGAIFSGTLPDFYGFTLFSGEQISFFLPMLEDTSLELAQDVTVNSGQNREMQYLAMWNSTKDYIVQIGMEPIRLLQALRENELSYIIKSFPPLSGTMILAIDIRTEQIISATDESVIGKTLNEIGIRNYSTLPNNKTINTLINGKEGVAVFKEVNKLAIGINEFNETRNQEIISDIVLAVMICFIVGIIVIFLIYQTLEKVVLRGVYELLDGMVRITDGDLSYKVNVTTLPEFVKLSARANLMVQSVVESSRKFSTIFQYVNMPLALYEHRADQVLTTNKMAELLDLPVINSTQVRFSASEFVLKINSIMENPHPSEKDVYIFTSGSKVKYLKIKLYMEPTSNWGIVQDVTDEIEEKQIIKHERDIDVLTNLYNRRAFLEKADALFENITTLKLASIVMMDLDNLKFVNDSWGHNYGDEFIAKASEVLRNSASESDLIARLSGDEFVVLIYGAETLEELEARVSNIIHGFCNAYIDTPSGEKYAVTVSGGYAMYPSDGEKFRDLLQLADFAMYEAKRNNKGEFHKYKNL